MQSDLKVEICLHAPPVGFRSLFLGTGINESHALQEPKGYEEINEMRMILKLIGFLKLVKLKLFFLYKQLVKSSPLFEMVQQ